MGQMNLGNRIRTHFLRSVAELPARARAWIAAQLKRPRRHGCTEHEGKGQAL